MENNKVTIPIFGLCNVVIFLAFFFAKIFDKIDTSKDRPFYEFYRDIKIALSESHDANLDIFGGDINFGDNSTNFGDYR